MEVFCSTTHSNIASESVGDSVSPENQALTMEVASLSSSRVAHRTDSLRRATQARSRVVLPTPERPQTTAC